MYAVIGLGNPGKQYSGTRHNIGFEIIDYIARENNVSVTKIKHKSLCGEMFVGGEKVLLVKPQTYMNRSGEAVLDIHKYYKIPLENIIVIYDDIDLAVGKLRIRKKGSAGTHNGMRSILYQIQSEEFPRIRFGVGRPRYSESLIDFVIGKFYKDDIETIKELIETSAKAVEEIVKAGVDSSMNKYNR